LNIARNTFGLRLTDFGGINLGLTLDCGQCFRWKKLADGAWKGVVGSHAVRIIEDGEDLIFLGMSEDVFINTFYHYFDFDRDYDKALKRLSEDELLKDTIERYGTIRILNQEPWETLCSFILSSCNNIARIKGIIERLCALFGEDLGGGEFSFPSAERLAVLEPEDLDPVRCGYRAEYVIDAARKVAEGEIDLEKLKVTPLDDARRELMKIKGVGVKVADCTLLFGLGHMSAFPKDRHILRIAKSAYPDGLPECVKGLEGLAQQYMFHFQRTENGRRTAV